jgi:membrane-bound lytic murein transglycosylase D
MERLKKIPSVFELVYNPIVKKYIELYTMRRRKQMSYMLGVGNYYFPIFEQALDALDLPMELKYLPVIESALNPRAYSVAGASGLWQFMYGTGKIYGLQGNSLVDERRDPIKATNAAVRFLRDLYKMYGDWAMVIAAYNCGPGNVNKAIKRSGGKKDYWAIYPYLPKETRGYVPAFIAATYAMTYHKEHKICPTRMELPYVCDTVVLKDRMHLEQISSVLGIDIETLRNMNPQYRKDIIPGNGEAYTLCLPENKVGSFIDMKDSIMAYKADSFSVVTKVVVLPAKADPYYRAGGGAVKKGIYVVKRGDTLSGIAQRRKVSIAKIKKWNNLKSDRIYIGQKLRIY